MKSLRANGILRVTGITLKQDRKVYMSDSYAPWKRYHTMLDSDFIFKPNAEYSGKRSPIKQICYTGRSLDEDEIVISGDIAKELGITIGDKIHIGFRLFGKPDDNYLAMYEKNPKKFIKYFSKQSDTNKKRILNDILEQEFVNEEAVSWLDKHESKLIREVGLE